MKLQKILLKELKEASILMYTDSVEKISEKDSEDMKLRQDYFIGQYRSQIDFSHTLVKAARVTQY